MTALHAAACKGPASEAPRPCLVFPSRALRPPHAAERPSPPPPHPCQNQVSGEKEFFSEMVVSAVTRLDPSTLDLKMIGMKKVRQGGWGVGAGAGLGGGTGARGGSGWVAPVERALCSKRQHACQAGLNGVPLKDPT
jgi:hypothetical protein